MIAMTEAKPFLVDLKDGKRISVMPDNHTVMLFWEYSEGKDSGEDCDYIDYSEYQEDGEHHWWVFNPEMARWMGNIALRESDKKDLRLSNRSNGTFFKRAGWRSHVEVNQQPNEQEIEGKIHNIIGNDLEDIHGALAREIKKDNK